MYLDRPAPTGSAPRGGKTSTADHVGQRARAPTGPARPRTIRARRTEGDQAVDLRLLIAAGRRSEVEVQPVLARLRRQRRPPHVMSGRRAGADRGLLVLVPDQRPPRAALQKYPTSANRRTTSRREPAAGEEVVAGSMTQNSLPSGSASTTCASSGTGRRRCAARRARAPCATVCCWPRGGAGQIKVHPVLRLGSCAGSRNRIRNPVSSSAGAQTPSWDRPPAPRRGSPPRSARGALLVRVEAGRPAGHPWTDRQGPRCPGRR